MDKAAEIILEASVQASRKYPHNQEQAEALMLDLAREALAKEGFELVSIDIADSNEMRFVVEAGCHACKA